MSLYERIYIAGKVTGLPMEQVKQKFETASDKIKIALKAEVYNPIKLICEINRTRRLLNLPPWTDDNHRKHIMGACLQYLSNCDTLYLLPDWNTSKGAIMERDFALKMRMNIIYG